MTKTKKTWLCTECGRELRPGGKCPECGCKAEGIDLLRLDMNRPKRRMGLFYEEA